jgi:hypothetical protein
MGWFRWSSNSPFANGEDAAKHMVALVSAQAEKVGAPLSEEERRLLLAEATPPQIAEAESDEKFRKLIEQTFDSEVDDPMNFSSAIQWAGAERYPKVVALAEDIITSSGEKRPRLRGRRAIIDLVQLVGCGLVTVILMMLVVALFSWLFGHK